MANKKPTPPTQASISQGFIQPYDLANLGKPQFEEKPLRGEHISLKSSEPYPDDVKDFTIGLEDVDNALINHITQNIKPSIIQNGERIVVPTIYGSPERWKSIQSDGYYRDKNGKMLYPIIVIKRNSVTKDKTIGNKIDGNRVHLYKNFKNPYTQRNIYDAFGDINNRIPVEEYSKLVIPDYVTITYNGIIYTDLIEQMNGLVESFNFASDSYWGDKERFMFKTTINSFSTITEVGVDEDRVVKSEFSLTINGYLIPDTINKELASVKKEFSKATVRINSEIQYLVPDNNRTPQIINAPQFQPFSTVIDGLSTIYLNRGGSYICSLPDESNVELNGTNVGNIIAGGTGSFQIWQSGSQIGNWTGVYWNIPTSSIRNSTSPTWEENINAGVVKTLSQSKALDSDQVTILSASYIPMSQGFMFSCSPLVLPSLTIAFEYVTKTFGVENDITVSPLGFTPTLYTFHIPQRDGSNISVTQASNVYAWTPDAIGSVSIRVTATNGIGSTAEVSTTVTVLSVYLLDTYTTAHFAVSVRKLRSAYAGSCLNVRRSSDNTQQNIGFVNDLLDTASLISFVGVGNGFEATWYDQSTTAGNATQATATIQPFVMTNGLVAKANGIPTIAFGSYYYNYLGLTLTSRTTKTIFTVFQKNGNPRQYVTLLGLAGDYGIGVGGQNAGIYLETPGGNLLAASFDNLNLNQLTILFGTTGAARIRGNGTQLQTGTTSANVNIQRVGAYTSSTSRYMVGNISEIILFPDDQTANFAVIEGNQRAYFKTQ